MHCRLLGDSPRAIGAGLSVKCTWPFCHSSRPAVAPWGARWRMQNVQLTATTAWPESRVRSVVGEHVEITRQVDFPVVASTC